MLNERKITILPKGPYEVSGDVPLKQAVIEIDAKGTSEAWATGREYDLPEGKAYHLCRCGHSKNKPFCDGAHVAIGFEGEERADNKPCLEGCTIYEGGEVDLYDNEGLCASMRFCERGKGVWQAVIDSADPSSRDLAIEEACSCAAGRLTIVKKDGTPVEQDLAPEVSPIEDTAIGMRGPLWVKGGIPLEGADGTQYEKRNRMTLCRCGESRNMPFCDISHRRCTHMEGFDD